MGHFRICTEEGASEFREFDAHLRRRLRAIIIHQKKRARFFYRHLVKREASPRQAAGTAYSRRGHLASQQQAWDDQGLPQCVVRDPVDFII